MQVWEWSGMNCFADDTGLEVEALNGAPGVYSARFAGPQCNSADNRARLLRDLDGKTNRRARFRTVFCLIQNGREHLFEGTVHGVILTEERGSGGFGYDALFCPEGSERSFAEMTPEEKNALSHRARAAEKMAEFLKKG
jgi:XTP/dITP diphosphohydrolase